MFNRLSFKGQPDTYTLTLGYSDGDISLVSPTSPSAKTLSSLGVLTQETAIAKWSSNESEADILQRVKEAANNPNVQLERICLKIVTPDTPGFWGIVNAASYADEIKVDITIESTKPTLHSITLLHDTTGSISTTVGLGIWSSLALSHVTRLHCNDGVASLWDISILKQFSSLRVLNLSHSNISTLPGMIGNLTTLQELRLVGNHLKMLPPDLGKLDHLRVLAVDSNELSILPGELRKCSRLEELTLENNRLTSVLLNFGAMHSLKTLLLSGNPLEFLPEISPCQELRSLSVANLRVRANHDFSTYDVELYAPTGPSSSINISIFDSKPTDKLRPIFSLMLRRSSGHHPLLAGAFRHLAEDPKNRELMVKQENALQQLILMALNDSSVIVDQTCKTLALLAQHSPTIAEDIIDTDAGSMVRLLRSDDHQKQLASLNLIGTLGVSSDVASDRLLNKELLLLLLSLIRNTSVLRADVRCAALCTLGNLSFTPKGKGTVTSNHDIMDILLDLSSMPQKKTDGDNDNNNNNNNKNAARQPTHVPIKIRAAAIRALAILGDSISVSKAVGRSLPSGRGIRILSLDGGGMKGMATVQLLRRLEQAAGQPIHSLFDLIVGTSTGGLLAVAMGIRKFSMDECESIYKVLGQRVFSRPTTNKEKDEGWMESFYRTFHSKTQHVRAVVVGYKHDASVYEVLLKEYCHFTDNPECLDNNLIDSAGMDVPKIALVATHASSSPAAPFVFRNYELPAPLASSSGASMNSISRFGTHPGSSKHPVWQAVRASSAAIYYLDDFTCGNDKFQDGAVVANNPGVIAFQEARALWPDTPIDVLISVGTGSTPTNRRDKGISSFVDTGNILIESATNVERAHEALATMAPLMPNMKYFRFNPVDERCSMELDEIDPEKWAQLESAMEDFIREHAREFDAAGAALVVGNNSDDEEEEEEKGEVEPERREEGKKKKGEERGEAYTDSDAAICTSTSRVTMTTPTTLSSPKSRTTTTPVNTPHGDTTAEKKARKKSAKPKVILGLHRGVFIVTSPSMTGEQRVADVAAAACLRLPFCCKALDLHVAAVNARMDSENNNIHHRGSAAHNTATTIRNGGDEDGINRQTTISVAGGTPASKSTHTLQTHFRNSHGSATTSPIPTPSLTGKSDKSKNAAEKAATTAPTAIPPTDSSAVVEVDIGSALGSVLSWFSPSKRPDSILDSQQPSPRTPVQPAVNPEEMPPSASPPRSALTTNTASAANTAYASLSPGVAKKKSPVGNASVLMGSSPFRDEDDGNQKNKNTLTDENNGAMSSSLSPSLTILKQQIENELEAGILHISLSSCAVSKSPVLQWEDSFIAINVPSKESTDLVQSSGYDASAMTLLEVFEKNGGQIMLGTTAVRAVSTQYRRSSLGHLSAVVLVQYTSPKEVLDAIAIRKLRSVFRGKFIVCSDVLNDACIDEFIGVGAVGVLAPVMPLEHVPACSGSVLSAFFSQIYADVQVGGDCLKALKKAEATFSSLDRIFELHYPSSSSSIL